MSYQIGDRVVLIKGSNLQTYNEYEDDTIRGVIKSLTEYGEFSIEWDSGWRDSSTYLVEELMAEVEAEEILSQLEAEYEAWAAPIREKMEQAGKLLEEAGQLATNQKFNIIEMHEVVSPLLRAMRNLGWSTSSLNC